MTVVLGEGDHRYGVERGWGRLLDGNEPGQFISPHGIAVAPTGSIYVGEVSRTAWGHYNPGVPMPEPLHCLSKLTKLDQEPLT